MAKTKTGIETKDSKEVRKLHRSTKVVPKVQDLYGPWSFPYVSNKQHEHLPPLSWQQQEFILEWLRSTDASSQPDPDMVIADYQVCITGPGRNLLPVVRQLDRERQQLLLQALAQPAELVVAAYERSIVELHALLTVRYSWLVHRRAASR